MKLTINGCGPAILGCEWVCVCVLMHMSETFLFTRCNSTTNNGQCVHLNANILQMCAPYLSLSLSVRLHYSYTIEKCTCILCIFNDFKWCSYAIGYFVFHIGATLFMVHVCGVCSFMPSWTRLHLFNKMGAMKKIEISNRYEMSWPYDSNDAIIYVFILHFRYNNNLVYPFRCTCYFK